METMESTAAALADGMIAEEPAQEQAADVSAEDLMQEAQTQETQEAPGEAQEGGEEPAQEDGGQSSADARTAEIQAGIRELFDSGWDAKTLSAFAADPQARADVAAGKSVAQAANAYAMRLINGGAGAAKPHAKGGVPAIRKAAGGDVKPQLSLEDMTDAQFDEFSRRAREAAMMGKKVRM